MSVLFKRTFQKGKLTHLTGSDERMDITAIPLWKAHVPVDYFHQIFVPHPLSSNLGDGNLNAFLEDTTGSTW